jgi:predicted DNA-binding transcriptional regulator AlpA
MSQHALDPIFSEQELAAWLNTSRPTLQRQRSDGSGPEFVRLSERRIGYRKSAVERWLASRTARRGGDQHPDKPEPSCASSADRGNVHDTALADTIAGPKLSRGVAPQASRHRGRP